jgi:plastocyanin
MRRTVALAAGAALLAALVAPAVLLAQEPAPGEAPAPAEAPPPGDASQAPPATSSDEPSQPPAADPAPGSESATAGGDDTSTATPLAVAAGAGGVTMADFSFTPATITVSVGDTVTWSNSGPDERHTATADDGSFDTGEVAVGSSASHTFTEAGTFAYTCSLHPDQMSGTVIVEAAGGAGGGGGGGSDTEDSTGSTPGVGSEEVAGTAPDAAGSASKLPSTGLLAVPLALVGAGLLGLGLWIRRSRGRLS